MDKSWIIRSVASGNGFTWFRHGWRAFRNAPGILIGVLLLWLILSAAAQFIPIIGPLGFMLISPALFGGYLRLCQAALHDQSPALDQFFSGLTDPGERGELLILGILLLVAHVGILIICGLFFIFTALLTLGTVPYETLQQLQSGAPLDAVLTVGMLLVLLLTALLGMLAYTLLTMTFTYASPLVLDGRARAVAALSLSFGACLQNILPLTVFGLFYLIFFLLALIPFGLGLIIFAPLSMAAIAASYEDMFVADGRFAQ